MDVVCTNCVTSVDELNTALNQIVQYQIIQTEILVLMGFVTVVLAVFQLVALWARRF